MKILLVDDDPSFLKLHKIKLTLDGFSVITAENGREALNLVSDENPNLLVLDLQMPILDGFEMMTELKKSKFSSIPKIVLSSYDQPSIIETCLNLGANEYLVKSQVTPEEVAEVIDRLVGKVNPN